MVCMIKNYFFFVHLHVGTPEWWGNLPKTLIYTNHDPMGPKTKIENETFKKKLDFIILSRLKKVLGNMKGRIYLYLDIDTQELNYVNVTIKFRSLEIRDWLGRCSLVFGKKISKNESVLLSKKIKCDYRPVSKFYFV